VLLGGVVRDPVQDDAKVSSVCGLQQRVEVRKRPEDRRDVFVVADVVAEVRHRGAVERRQPHRFNPELHEMIESREYARKVADAIAVGIAERARIHLVDRPALPPSKHGVR
jgi:hypothetical protein